MLTDTPETQYVNFLGRMNVVYRFQVRAKDNVDNESGWTESGPVLVAPARKYYAFGGSKVAMRVGSGPANETEVYYLHGDHLGSTSLTTDDTGTKISEVRYHPYGEERHTSGGSPTDFGFTSQRAERGFGLMDYNARYYSPVLGRFISPDTIVPEPTSSGGFNRFAYVSNNPLNFIDPTGHCREEDENYSKCVGYADQIASEIGSDKTWNGESIYDLNWENQEQVEEFISLHNELPDKLENLQAWTDYITNDLGPHPEDFWRRWEAISYNEEQIGNFAYAFYYKAFDRGIEAAPIEGAWKDPAKEVVTWTAETLTVEIITEPAAILARGELLVAVALAEAGNVAAQIVVNNQAILARGEYTLSQPQHPRFLD